MTRTFFALTCLALSCINSSCVNRAVIDAAGDIETATRGSSYIKTGSAIYDIIRPTK
jgi:hypothetical protein